VWNHLSVYWRGAFQVPNGNRKVRGRESGTVIERYKHKACNCNLRKTTSSLKNGGKRREKLGRWKSTRITPHTLALNPLGRVFYN